MQRQKLDLLLPTECATQGSLPVIAFIHVGAWRAGDKNSGIDRLTPFVADGDYAGVSIIGYRLSSDAPWPAQIHDGRSASPITHISADDAPVLNVHGTADPLVPYQQSLEFNRRLSAAGVISNLVTVHTRPAGAGVSNTPLKRRQGSPQSIHRTFDPE